MLCYRKAPIALYFGYWVTNISVAGHFLKECIVSAATLRAALYDMSSRQSTCEGIIVVPLPVEFPCRRPDYDSSISHSWADDYICALIERFLDRPATEIHVSSEGFLICVFQIHARIKIGEFFALVLKISQFFK